MAEETLYTGAPNNRDQKLKQQFQEGIGQIDMIYASNFPISVFYFGLRRL